MREFVYVWSGVDRIRGLVWYCTEFRSVKSERVTDWRIARSWAEALRAEHDALLHDCSDQGTYLQLA